MPDTCKHGHDDWAMTRRASNGKPRRYCRPCYLVRTHAYRLTSLGYISNQIAAVRQDRRQHQAALEKLSA